jgi:hypothetical protein
MVVPPRYTSALAEVVCATASRFTNPMKAIPGLPGCWSQGSTEAEAIDNIKDAIREYLSVIEEQLHGEEVREVEVVA